MQILQSQLGMTFPPLGQNSSLGIANSFFSKKNSNLLHLSSFIKPLAILKPLLTSSHLLIEGGKNGHLRSWDNLKTALKTDFSTESAKFQFENLDKNLEIYENANENNENFIEKPKNLKKSAKKTSNTDNSNKNLASSELATRKNAKSKKPTTPQSKANPAKSKKATKKNSAKKVESRAMQQSLNAEQGIAANSPTVVPTPEILTPVGASDVLNNVTTEAQPQPSVSDVPNNSTTETQTTQPSQPSQHKPTASTSQQIPKVTPTVITPDVNNKLKPTQLPGASTTASPTLGNESTVMRQSLNAEQGITPDSPTVVPIPEILTPVGVSDVPNNVTTKVQPQPSVSDVPNNSTTETQTTQPSQPSQHKPTASTSQQIPKVTPTVITPDVNNKLKPTQLPGASTTASPTLGNESTVMRQSLNAEQGITPDSPTVVPTPDILTPVEESNVPNNVTTKAQPQPSILDLSNNVTAQT
ncbi:hypothetical protein, partial [Scytonema sp. PCC 10023]|uniref:hypothetical protein n=1 Tax=Scytonema sp. PCC 10023 TaxID=1680591 RepID=UPI0039C6B972